MKYALILTTILSAAALEAAPVVSNVSMTQAANRDVTVTYTLSGAPAVITLDVLTNGVSIGAKNLSELAGDVNRLVETDGTHTITFSADYTWANQEDAVRMEEAKPAVTAWPATSTPDILVVNLAATNAVHPRLRWYVSEEALPGGLLSNVMYRTTALVLKRIHAAGVMYYRQKPKGTVYLDRDFYIGIFPLTFAQLRLIKTDAVSEVYTNEGENLMRAAVKLSYEALRGANYPAAPTTGSILGTLSAMSGLDFDLPGDTEWEYAASAGLPTEPWPQGLWPNGKPMSSSTRVNAAGAELTVDDNFPGRYKGNSYPEDTKDFGGAQASWPAQYGVPIVGSCEPNLWGLYDMLGCTWEYPREVVGTSCYIRGGAWNKELNNCEVGYRSTSTLSNSAVIMGARLACPVGF